MEQHFSSYLITLSCWYLCMIQSLSHATKKRMFSLVANSMINTILTDKEAIKNSNVAKSVKMLTKQHSQTIEYLEQLLIWINEKQPVIAFRRQWYMERERWCLLTSWRIPLKGALSVICLRLTGGSSINLRNYAVLFRLNSTLYKKVKTESFVCLGWIYSIYIYV